jgi:hypothetical protein
MTIGSHELAATSRLFSSAVFREMATRGRSNLFARLFRQSPLSEARVSLSRVSDAFEAAFDILRAGGCRDEYIYKAALTHRVLLGTHSLKTACMMTEFRVENCKADLAILNGTSTVYEIKSERDSLSRLERQLEAYKKVFARVFVIAGENHVETVLQSTSADVGVMRLSNRYQISTIREAEDRPDRLSPSTIFDAVRTKEAKQILKRLGVATPNVPNTELHSELRKCFLKLDRRELHFAMVETLRQSRSLLPLNSLIDCLPLSLTAAALSISVRKADHQRLVSAVNTPLRAALNWA